MEIIKGWRVVQMVKTTAGLHKQQILSRIFSSRDTALAYAKQCGDGVYIQTVKADVDDVKARLW